MRYTHPLFFLAIAGPLTMPAAASAQNREESAIRAVAVRQGETWSRRDAKAYAALFTENCDVINVVGWWWKGRAELQSKLTAAFAYVFKDSKLSITDVQVRFLTPSIAVVHARWTMSGARTPPGIPEPREGIQTLVVTKVAGGWLIAAFQNTNSTPEQPFPPGPPGPGEP